LNLQRIKQVVVYAALVALVVAGAGLYSTQPVAGRENKQQTLHGAAVLDQLKQDGQYESLQAAMQQARFSVSHAEQTPLGRAAWHAPNPTAGYDAYVTEAGVSIAVNGGSYVSLSLHSLGYGAAIQGVGPGEVSGDRQTINLTRDGGVREWYINGPDGLEQGFTLAEPLGARQPGVPLRLAMQVNEGWRAVPSDDGNAVVLRGAGTAVEYGKLVVSDSQGSGIPARLTVDDARVVIEVEDSEAVYPLTIDPVFSMQQKLVAADGTADDRFGSAVALDGDTLVVGAVGDDIGTNANQGSAYVFTRSGATWTQQQKITANDGAASDGFGVRAALSGDTLVVSAYIDDIGANLDQGSVYVFTRSGGVWTQQQKLTANDGAANDLFGVSLAMSSDTLVVGVFGSDIGENNAQGSAYVYTRNGSVWTQQQKLIASDGAAHDIFGIAVGVSGDTVVVGAHQDDTGANSAQGSAYVFTRSGTVWTQQQKLTATDGAAEDWFGSTVAVSGDTAVVGAPLSDNGTNANQGSTYVFTRSGGVWTQQQKLTANDGEAGDSFGGMVALDGDTLAVSARYDDLGASFDVGSVYVFKLNGGVWTELDRFEAIDGDKDDNFGSMVALSGDTLLVGVGFDDVNTNINQGSAYIIAVSSCSALAFAPASLPNGVQGISYKQQITVTGGTGQFQFTLGSGTLPPGLTLTTKGLLSGVPTTPGTYYLKIRATNLNTLCTGIGKYTITIAPPPACTSLTIDPPALPNGAKGAQYSLTLTAIGGTEPYKFGVKGKLPPGLTLSAGGVLSGIPKQVGTFSFWLLVADANGCTGLRADSITITDDVIEIGVAPRR
jgi:hypothetical protein